VSALGTISLGWHVWPKIPIESQSPGQFSIPLSSPTTADVSRTASPAPTQTQGTSRTEVSSPTPNQTQAPLPTQVARQSKAQEAERGLKESEEGRQLAAQLVSDVERLADEGRAIDLTDYQQAVKTYNKWADKCAATLERIDGQMRRFGRNTHHEFDWDNNDSVWRRLMTEQKDSDRGLIRSALSSTTAILEAISGKIKLDTMPDPTLLRVPSNP